MSGVQLCRPTRNDIKERMGFETQGPQVASTCGSGTLGQRTLSDPVPRSPSDMFFCSF